MCWLNLEENFAAMSAQVNDLQGLVEKISLGGPAKARQKHLERNKLLPRQRVERLLDPGSPFLEFSQLAGHGLYGHDDVPAGPLPFF